MQNITSKVLLILAVVGFCLYAVIPPSQKIRLGKDLAGGFSAVYSVNIPEGADSQRVLTQTIEVLKDRLDPNGQLDISMQPLGQDRLEIVVPLPNEEVVTLRKAYEGALETLLKNAEVKPITLDESVRHGTAVAQFGGDPSSERGQRVAALQAAYNRLQTAEEALSQAKSQAEEGEALFPLESAVASARVEFKKAREAVLKLSLDRARVVRAINLPTKVSDETGKEAPADNAAAAQPKRSQRDVAIDALKSEFAHLAGDLDAVVTAYDAYRAKRKGFDDPEDLLRLLRGSGVLEFHIAVNANQPEGVNIEDMRRQLADSGPDRTDSSVARWYPINDLKQWYEKPEQLEALEADPIGFFSSRGFVAGVRDQQYYLLLYTTRDKSMTHEPGTSWSIESTFESPDNLGRPGVSFRLNEAGGLLMARLTGANIEKPMAIVLDGQVFSAPTLQSTISRSGIITGSFSRQELSYLIRVLAAGALEARLSENPISISILGPSLGKDNLVRGGTAFLLSLIVTAAIMLVYYFFAGFIANVALLINAILIFGTMALIDGTLTLPGLAGIALSVAMAVDSNVLIYERIREEIVNNREDLRTAIRLGYNRAMNAIIDGNVTHLITCIVLMNTATTEVKGFALTMILGVCATFFSALFVTRVLYTFYTEYFKIKTLPMLPTVMPGIHRALTPSVNWISKRHVFFAISALVCVASLALVYSLGKAMLDTEFRGGITMTMQTRFAEGSEPKGGDGRLLLKRPEVQQRIQQIGEQAGPDDPILYQLRNASVLTVGPMTPDFEASQFQIKVASPPKTEDEKTITDAVVNAVVQNFEKQLDVVPALSFRGNVNGDPDPNHEPHTYPIESESLGQNIQQPEFTTPVSEFRGGVAVVVEGIEPPVTIESATERIQTMRSQPDFSSARGRTFQVVGLTPVAPGDPSRGYRSIAVLVSDPEMSSEIVDVDVWDREMAATEWRLVASALARGSSMQEVNSFSPAIARSLAASAYVAVVLSLLGMLVYIWVRFGSLRYSVATIIAVSHNVVICLGALALTHYVAGTSFASLIGLDEFRIDLNVIAALLTIIGYSLNDTIVILDRIRENRGKRLAVSAEIINTSVNQTFSRTILTGGSTIIASIILYALGGTGIQPFAFTFLIGLVVGTYSSVTIAAPLVYSSKEASLAAAQAAGPGLVRTGIREVRPEPEAS